MWFVVLLVGADAADLRLIGTAGLRGGLGGHGVGAGAVWCGGGAARDVGAVDGG